MFGWFDGLFEFDIIRGLEGSMLLQCVRHYKSVDATFVLFPTTVSITSGDDDLDDDLDPGRDDIDTVPPPSGIGILDWVGIGRRTVGRVGSLKLSGATTTPSFVFILKVLRS